jgi:hypothetical protein
MSLSFALDLSDTINLQLLLGMGVGSSAAGTSVLLSSGLAFRYTLFGDRKLGFHAGAGTTLGTNGNFGVEIMPLVGFHWMLLEHVAFHVDLGPNFFINATPGAATFAFTMASHGNPFGLSLHYYF